MAKFDHCDHRPNLQGEAVERDTPEPLTPARNEPPTNDTPESLTTCKGIELPPMEATEPMKQGIGDSHRESNFVLYNRVFLFNTKYAKVAVTTPSNICNLLIYSTH